LRQKQHHAAKKPLVIGKTVGHPIVRPFTHDRFMMYFIDRYFIKQPKLRSFVTRLLEGNRDSDVAMLGTTVRVNSIKEHGYLRASRIANSSALLREELPVIINMAALLSDGDTFVDCGANVGIYSLTLARMKRILPKTRFYAFEANPDTFARLSGPAEKLMIEAHNLALSDHNGSLDFVAGAVSHVFTTIENSSEYSIAGKRVSVPCRRLDEMEIQGNSIVLKIDVEGQEKNVLDGSLELFRAHRVKAVYLDGYKDKGVESFLIEHGFSLLDGKTLEPTTGGVFNLLAIHNGQRT
jgi:FkbM family methyltransferase